MKKRQPVQTTIFGNEESTVTLEPEAPAAPLTPTQFVQGKTPTKRLMLEIPAELHRRMKIQCAKEGRWIAEVARELFEKRFPPAP
jgi:hypothetical protein